MQNKTAPGLTDHGPQLSVAAMCASVAEEAFFKQLGNSLPAEAPTKAACPSQTPETNSKGRAERGTTDITAETKENVKQT